MSRKVNPKLRKLLFRLRAIRSCLYFGLLPWQFYEKKCHYEGISYWEHVKMNFRRIKVFLKRKIKFGDIRFEIKVNKL